MPYRLNPDSMFFPGTFAASGQIDAAVALQVDLRVNTIFNFLRMMMRFRPIVLTDQEYATLGEYTLTQLFTHVTEDEAYRLTMPVFAPPMIMAPAQSGSGSAVSQQSGRGTLQSDTAIETVPVVSDYVLERDFSTNTMVMRSVPPSAPGISSAQRARARSTEPAQDAASPHSNYGDIEPEDL